MSARRIDPLRDVVTLRVDGKKVRAEAGENVATALVASGRWLFGRSVKYHRPRGPQCFVGRCDGCLLRVDGVPNVPSCTLTAREGMRIETQNVIGSAALDVLALTDIAYPEGLDHHHMFTRFAPANRLMKKIARQIAGVGKLPDRVDAARDVRDEDVDVLVIGGGNAGLRCANEAVRAGAKVVLIEPRRLGGLAALVFDPVVEKGPPVDRRRSAVVGVFHEVGAGFTHREEAPDEVRWVITLGEEGLTRFRPRRVVVATGANETSVAFPSNDRPGVIGAVGALELLRQGILPGEDVLLIGAGRGLKVAGRELRNAGARTHGPFAAQGDDIVDVELEGRWAVKRAHHAGETYDCDLVVMGGPLAPNVEVAMQAGAEVRFTGKVFEVVADDEGRTHDPTLFAIGRCTGRRGEAAAAQAVRAGRAVAQ
ncbi:MAG: (2Fe-2S)-binding protein [Deltaproteobacteria bacterium]|nr:(2Fe-2S)-binding protein [Deltaproteobacteria bacterium]